MVLKTLVDAISQSLRDPHNLLHVQLVQSLKRDISQDVTEAFTESQPLVDQYPDVYRQSSSFLDFLFKLCNAPLPPVPSFLGGEEEKKRIELESQIHRLESALHAKTATIQQLEAELQAAEKDRMLQQQGLSDLRAQLEQCQQEKSHWQSQFNDSETQRVSQAAKSEPQVTFPKNPLSESPLVLPLEYHPPSDPFEKHLEQWQDKLFEFLNTFKRDLSENVACSSESYEKLTHVLQKHFPHKDLTQDACKISNLSDEWSEALFAKLEAFLTRMLDETQLEASLKLFQLDPLFDQLAGKVKTLVPKTTTKDKLVQEIHHTRNNVQALVKQVIQKVSTLFGSKMPSLAILERLDDLEQSLMDKSIQLERLLDTQTMAKEMEMKERQFMAKLEEVQQDIREKDLNPNTTLCHQVQALEAKVTSHDQHMFGLSTQAQLLWQEDRHLAASTLLQDYCKHQLPDIGYQSNWQDHVISYLVDMKETKYYMHNILKNYNIPSDSDAKLVHMTHFIISNLIHSVSQAREKMDMIYQKMLSLTDVQTQHLMAGSQHADETFFQWLERGIRDMKTQLKMAQFCLTEQEASDMQQNLQPKDFDPHVFASSQCTVEELEEDAGRGYLALPYSSTLHQDTMRQERDKWMSKCYEEEEKVTKLKLKVTDIEAKLHLLTTQCTKLVDDFEIEDFYTKAYTQMKKHEHSTQTLETLYNSLETILKLDRNSPNWINEVLTMIQQKILDLDSLQQRYTKCTEDLNQKGRELNELRSQKQNLEERLVSNEQDLCKIQSKYDEEVAKLKSHLLSTEIPKEPQTMGSSRKRKTTCSDYLGDELDDHADKELLKNLFVVFYEKHFEMLFRHKWVNQDFITEELRAELKAKTELLNSLHSKLRNSQVLDILLRYAAYESKIFTQDGDEMREEDDQFRAVEKLQNITELVNFSMHKTVTAIEGLLQKHSVQISY